MAQPPLLAWWFQSTSGLCDGLPGCWWICNAFQDIETYLWYTTKLLCASKQNIDSQNIDSRDLWMREAAVRVICLE